VLTRPYPKTRMVSGGMLENGVSIFNVLESVKP
jgi:hypothetical protein